MQLEGREMLAPQRLTRERYQQHFGHAQVLGGQITVYRDATGVTTLVIGAYYPNIAPANRASLSPADARRTAEHELGSHGTWRISLLIDPQTGRYFYRVENQRFDSRKFYEIDAEDEAVLKKYNGLTTNHGIGVKGDTKSMGGLTVFNGSTFLLRSVDGRQITYDARNLPRFPFFAARFLPGVLGSDSDNHWLASGQTSPGQAALVDAAYYARVTDLYYASTHGRNSLDGAGLTMVSTAHFSRSYLNTFWNGSQMIYGDGGQSGGLTCIEFSGSVDVVGHELSHGVTEFTSNLIYQNESGALNESFSDIMATSIEFFAAIDGLDPAAPPDWLIGEDVCSLNGSPGLRNMADPADKGQPDHYSERQIGGSDDGGVHVNSGIPNHAYFLLVNGGSNAGEARGHPHSGPVVAGIGLAAAEQIFFLAFTGLPENATMCEARLATQAVAVQLFPTFFTSVSNAWEAVGVPDDC
jgi:Zn-dependent metalloprotease